MTKQRFLSLGFSVLLGCAVTSSLRAQQFTFQTFSIPPDKGSLSSVAGINDFGTTSGSIVDSHGNTEAFVRDPQDDKTYFFAPRNTSNSFTRANHINDFGVVVGDYLDNALNQIRGFFEFGGKFQSYTVPGTAPGVQNTLDAINNFGSFCGFVGNEAFVSINGKTTVFNVDSSSFSFCESINDLAWTVGAYKDNSGLWHGWIRKPFNGVITTYDAPGASTVQGVAPCQVSATGGTRIYGINDQGEIAGHFWDSSFVEHGFVLSLRGKFTKIDVPGAISTSLGSINNLGQVTGHYFDGSCNNLGYIGTPKDHDDDD